MLFFNFRGVHLYAVTSLPQQLPTPNEMRSRVVRHLLSFFDAAPSEDHPCRCKFFISSSPPPSPPPPPPPPPSPPSLLPPSGPSSLAIVLVRNKRWPNLEREVCVHVSVVWSHEGAGKKESNKQGKRGREKEEDDGIGKGKVDFKNGGVKSGGLIMGV